jgi:hypothetical protein
LSRSQNYKLDWPSILALPLALPASLLRVVYYAVRKRRVPGYALILLGVGVFGAVVWAITSLI